MMLTGRGAVPGPAAGAHSASLDANKENENTATKPDWDSLITRLGGQDVAGRAAAQQELDRVSYESHDALVTLAGKQADADVKSRLTRRVEAIDEQLAIDPPPISLHLNGVSLPGVADALSKETGLTLMAAGGDRNFSYILNIDKAPFWDVYAALSRQQPFQMIAMQPSQSRRVLLGPQVMRSYDLQGGFVAFAQSLELTRSFDPQGTRGPALVVPHLALSFAMAADPRINVLQAMPLRLLSVIDDRGNLLWQVKTIPADNPRTLSEVPSVQSVWTGTQALTIPRVPGKKLTSIKGEGRFVVQTAEVRREIADVEKHVNESINLGSRAITIRQFDASNARVVMQIVAPSSDAVEFGRVECTLLNGAGVTIWNGAANGDMNVRLASAQAGPFTLIVSASHKSKTISVPFELKDIPMP